MTDQQLVYCKYTQTEHLDNQGKTKDPELELKNFEKAGKVLAEIWSGMVIDKYPVVAEYIQPNAVENVAMEEVDHVWYLKHVRESQYFLQVKKVFNLLKGIFYINIAYFQISKCHDHRCCKPVRSDVFSVLKNRFFPPPIPMHQHELTGRLCIDEKMDYKKLAQEEESEKKKISFIPFFQRLSFDLSKKNSGFGTESSIPYDFFCPTVQSQLEGRSCGVCQHYFATKKSATTHMKLLSHKMSKKSKQSKRIKSIEAERDLEVLCIVHDDKYDTENLEWIEKKEFEEHSHYEIPKKIDDDHMPKIQASLEDWLQNPWIKDD